MSAFSHIHDSFLRRLASDLDPKYTYHDVNHTEQVIRQVTLLAEFSGISGRTLDLLKLAALFHDSGYLKSPIDHEERSCAIARNQLKDEDITPREVERICEMIMATKIPQNPTDELGCIMADGDLYHLGTDQYDIHAEKLFREMKNTKPDFQEGDWVNTQISFLRNHQFHTEFGKKELEPVKRIHLKKLEDKKG